MPDLNRTTPESAGVSSRNILAFIDAIEEKGIGMHSMMLLRHGSVLAEGWWTPYKRDDLHLLYSLSKSFISTAIGLAISEGRLSLDDTVISFFPDKAPADPSPNRQAMKVRHLLSMSAGQEKDDLISLVMREDQDWAKGFLEREVMYEPGTKFLYNSSASYMLSAILQRVTGETTLDYLKPRLLDPLGIEGATWESCPLGVNVGGWGMSVKTDDIARFGQLYLQKGMWNGQRLLTEEWVDTATSFQVSNAENDVPEWQQGYGFQFWRCRHNCYRGDGAFGQYCIVMPEAQMVFAATSATGDMQGVMNLVWEHLLLPVKGDSLPGDDASRKALTDKLASLKLAGPSGTPTSTTAERVSGKTYDRSSGEGYMRGARFDFNQDGATIRVSGECHEQVLSCGYENWIDGTWIRGDKQFKIGARGAWTANDEYTADICDLNSPMRIAMKFKFDDNSVAMTSNVQYHFGPAEGPSFEGVAVG